MKKIIYILPFLVLLAACSKEEITVTDKVVVQTLQAPNTALEARLLIDENNLEVGFQKVYFQFFRNNQSIQVSNFNFYPWMDMGMMQHGAPSQNKNWNSTLAMYEGTVVFSMSSSAGTWELITIVSDNGVSDTLHFSVEVNENVQGVKKVITTTGIDNEKYVLALVNPQTPIIGVNNLEIVMFQQVGNAYEIVENAIFEINPQMTSMGHGSPNNVNPVWDASSKYYHGKVNFTMSGDWRLFIDVTINNNLVLEQVFFDFNF